MNILNQGNYHFIWATFEDRVDFELGKKDMGKKGYEVYSEHYDWQMSKNVVAFAKSV